MNICSVTVFSLNTQHLQHHKSACYIIKVIVGCVWVCICMCGCVSFLCDGLWAPQDAVVLFSQWLFYSRTPQRRDTRCVKRQNILVKNWSACYSFSSLLKQHGGRLGVVFICFPQALSTALVTDLKSQTITMTSLFARTSENLIARGRRPRHF